MTEAVANGHLSIGEVLALVQADFPDVTISKIRFLESQGLIAPERTASGYRKFYDSDIDRLRWILGQQRDHFLPLKVIKRMLDQGVDVADVSQVQPSLFSSPGNEPEDVRPQSPGSTGSTSSTGSVSGGSGAKPADRATTRRSSAHPTVKASQGGSGGTDRHGVSQSASTAASPSEDTGRSEDRAASDETGRPTSGPGANTPDDQGVSTADDAPRRHSTPADVVAALQEDPRVVKSQRRTGESGAETDQAHRSPSSSSTPSSNSPSRAGSLGAPADGEPMARADLLSAFGVTEDLLADLESFGLIHSAMRGGTATYDAESQLVVRAAARYQELGVEPRHLRMYKVAAEREAGFVEQLVMPLMKQRNPASREQASERTDELLALGAELHSILIRRQLGPVLGT